MMMMMEKGREGESREVFWLWGQGEWHHGMGERCMSFVFFSYLYASELGDSSFGIELLAGFARLFGIDTTFFFHTSTKDLAGDDGRQALERLRP